LTSAAQTRGVAERLPVRDVAEILAEAVIEP